MNKSIVQGENFGKLIDESIFSHARMCVCVRVYVRGGLNENFWC